MEEAYLSTLMGVALVWRSVATLTSRGGSDARSAGGLPNHQLNCARGEILCIRAVELYQLLRPDNNNIRNPPKPENLETRGYARSLRKLERKAAEQ